MTPLTYMSSDSHFLEPKDMWVERLDAKFRDRAPRIIRNPNPKGAAWVLAGPGFMVSVAGAFANNKKGDELKEFMAKGGPDSGRPGGWDPVERIKDQDTDGVVAEVLYPSLGMHTFRIKDTELQIACFRVYNDWVAEFCSYNPQRMLGVGLISVRDVPKGIEELQRCAKLGLRGGMIASSPPAEKPYSHPDYDPLWRAAAELEMPLSLHAGTSSEGWEDPRATGAGTMAEWVANSNHEVQRAFTSIILGGVFERFPELRLVSTENDVGWLPYFMYRLDYAYDHYGAQSSKPLPRRPSEYIRNQLFATFIDEPIEASVYKAGQSNLMWSSDFPHGVSTWPRSREVITKILAEVPEDVRSRIIFENAAKLYHVEH
jgi:uncharacterized protein